MKRTALSVLLILALAGCISGKPEDTTYTSPSTGQTTVIQSDKEMCEQSCNDNYSRCMDTQAASSGDLHGLPTGSFGASGECRSELQSCLPGCKSR